jgi:curved DNA-binding protein
MSRFFISSTNRDLQDFRKEAALTTHAAGCLADLQENWTAEDHPPLDAFHGAPRTITLHAPEVDAQGHVTTHEPTLHVHIPKGVKQGQQIRLAEQGSPGFGGDSAGDLYLEVEFKSHPFYRVEGRGIPGQVSGNLYTLLRITLPPGNSERSYSFYRKMAQELAFDPRAGLGVQAW